MKPIQKAILAGIVTIVVYLTVVVLTTPALLPLDAINAALQLNSIVIFGMGIGIGLQVFVSEKSKRLGCSLKKKSIGGNTSSTAVTSFFSFFSLVPLGCCGLWLYALSLLPGILGTGASAILIEYSSVLAYGGLFVIFGFAGLSAFKLKTELKKQNTIRVN